MGGYRKHGRVEVFCLWEGKKRMTAVVIRGRLELKSRNKGRDGVRVMLRGMLGGKRGSTSSKDMTLDEEKGTPERLLCNCWSYLRFRSAGDT